MLLRSLIPMLCATLIMLGIGGLSLDPSRLHISGLGHGLNDQAGYVVTARNFVDTGRLEATAIYPSALRQEGSRNSFYMPGHALVLAASYRLLGHRPAAYLLPNLIAFFVAALCVWLLAVRLYGETAALLAGTLFVSFPANVVYAWTAMSELTLVGAAAMAICAAAWMPWRLRPWLAPLLIAIPFMFRETAAILCLPIAALVLRVEDETRHISVRVRVMNLVLFGALSGVALGVIHQSALSRGRASLMLNNLFSNNADAIYRDAYFTPKVPINMASILQATTEGAYWNLVAFWKLIVEHNFLLELYSILSLCVVGVVLCASPWILRKVDLFVVASGLLIVGLLAAIATLYTIHGLRGLRMLLIAVPAAAVAMGFIGEQVLKRVFGSAQKARWACWIACGLLLIVGGTTIASQHTPFTEGDHSDDNASAFLHSIHPEPDGLLVSPWYLSAAHLYDHYPVKWSFLPANDRTLFLLHDRHSVQTMVLPQVWLNKKISAKALYQIGLEHRETREYWPLGYFEIFKPRPDDKPIPPFLQ